jgi:HAD superfamily hydrolase (TIGR01549 family)
VALMLRAITLDYWDTLYFGASEPARVQRRREVVAQLVAHLGQDVAPDHFAGLYRASAAEAERWWREEHRGYTTADRIRWLLTQLGVQESVDGQLMARVVEDVDETLTAFPPAMLPGAREALAALGTRYRLAIVSDTGFASGRAQDRLLEQDGVRHHFAATVYSMDVGWAKPRPEPFRTALAALGVAPHEALHVGDIERTDVAGALGVGMRAIRLDAVRASGPTAAEHVAESLTALAHHLLR